MSVEAIKYSENGRTGMTLEFVETFRRIRKLNTLDRLSCCDRHTIPAFFQDSLSIVLLFVPDARRQLSYCKLSFRIRSRSVA